MNFVYLSPHFPPNFYHFCVSLKKYGANVLAIADVPYDELRTELKNALTEYYKVNNMENYDELLRAFGYFTHKYGKINGTDSQNEHWLETEAHLRSDFNIPGIGSDTIRSIKYKSEMKQKFIKGGLPVARGKVLKTLKEGKKFAEKTGYPLVAKPDKGVGATNTFKINNHNELSAFFAQEHKEEYIFEEFIEGQIYTFDGLTDKEGRAVFYTSHVYDSVMDMVNNKKNTFIYSLRKLPEELEEYGLKTLKAFNVKGRFFHFEFFKTPEGKFIALEVNMRPPGGVMLDMFNYANDINLYDEWANIIINNRFDAAYSRKYYCSFSSRRYDGRSYKHSHDEIFAQYRKYIVLHEEIRGIFAEAMGNYVFVARCEELEKLKELNNFILAEG